MTKTKEPKYMTATATRTKTQHPDRNGYPDEVDGKQVAKILGISKSSASAYATQGRIKKTSPGRYDTESVYAYRDSRRPARKIVKPKTQAQSKAKAPVTPKSTKAVTKAKPKPRAKAKPAAPVTHPSHPNMLRHLGRLDVFMGMVPAEFQADAANTLADFESVLREHGCIS